MGPRILFSAPDDHWPLWRPHLLAAFADAGLDVTLTDDPSGPWTSSIQWETPSRLPALAERGWK